MNFVKIGPQNVSYWVPVLLVEGYSSLIWTERYNDLGEFEMVHSDVAYVKEVLPIGTLVSLLETHEVMIVETNTIEEDDEGKVSAKLTGRSASSILESRIMGAELLNATNAARYVLSRQAVDKAAILICDWIVDPPSYPVAGFERNFNDYINNIYVTDGTLDGSSFDDSIVEMGDVLTAVLTILKRYNLGLRVKRPPNDPFGSVEITTIGFTSVSPPEPAIHTTQVNSPNLLFEIYEGSDKSRHAVFEVGEGDITHPSYLYSSQNYKNVVYLVAPWNSGYNMTLNGEPDSTYNGFDRKVLFVDGTGWSDIGAPTTANLDAAKGRARQELAKYNAQFFFDGGISLSSPYYKYNVGLGDLIRLRADFGVNQTMQVIEFIRTEDESGETAYPTLALPPVPA